MPDKALLRKALLKKRKKIPASLRHKKSRLVFKKLFHTPEFLRAAHVALYYGIVPEVATKPFLKTLLKDKKVYLPRICSGKKRMTLRQVRSLSKDLVKGPYDIMEPKLSCPERSAARIDLIIVPGVAFDLRGGRLGRGAGYYDRLLRRAGKAFKVGLCFLEQIVKKVPMTARDVRVDRVITD